MTDTKYSMKMKKQFKSKQAGTLLAAIVLLVGIVTVSIKYFNFVSQTVYHESVSHLTEIFHQSNSALNELVNKNLTYLHMWSEYLQNTSSENEIRDYIDKAQKETEFSNFYFLSAEGNYQTVSGETGYLGLQGNIEDQITQKKDIIMNATLPGKPQLLVFACPEVSGTYQGFEYDAIAVAYNNSDIVKVLDIAAFDGSTSSYVIQSDGRVMINHAVNTQKDVYNFLAFLREHSDLSEEDVLALAKKFQQENSGAMLVNLDGKKYYLIYEAAEIMNWTLLGIVPADVVNASMNNLQFKTMFIIGGIVFSVAVIIIIIILKENRLRLKRKDTEILYRDELFQKLSMNVDDIFLMIDAKTSKVDYVSPNVEKLLGITVEEVQKDIRILEKLHPKDSEGEKSNYLENLLADEQREQDFEYIHQKSKEQRWFHIIAMGSNVEGKKKCILVMSDRTADKKMNQALSEAVRAAETANRAKSTFLSNMSHDIRTPMNAIIGFTTLAVSNIKNQEKVQDYLSKILSSSNHLLSLINDILDMSRIESGKMHLEETEVNLSDLLHNLKTIIGGQIHAKQLELYMDAMDVTDEDVYCDKTRLNQVLLNLLSNAIKFTPAGGTVSVRLKQYQGTDKERSLYEIRVKDTGIGMSPEFARKIFDPFERERTSTVSKTQGTGLGMAITRNIVDMMGGTIGIQTKQGKGTEFIVRLPLRIQSGHRHVEKIAELEGLKALVVDDDFNTCDSVTKMLIKVGMRSEWTLSGKEAILRARQSMEMGDAFHAYIVDWRLPDMNGIEVTRRIRSLGDDTPIIILTAYDWSEIKEEANDAGVTAFCSKPMFMSDLRETLMTALGEKQDEIHDGVFPSVGPEFKNKHILLVEDNELNREIALEILTNCGFCIDTAENGVEAVEKVKNSTEEMYDLVLMDIQMPVMDGYEATRQIRAIDNSALSRVPIIAMTANAFSEDKQTAISVGMNGHVAKPIDINVLLPMILKYIK